jgi:CRP/FNR family cyclic AMP-dependent transcriptional regulator
MSALELLGYFGGVLIFSTFYLKTMIRLRIVAIASNLVYIAYGALGGLVPILLLHALLLPLNVWRLIEVKQLVRRVRASAQNGTTAPELIVPYMQQIKLKKGEQVFAKGDNADCVYYVFRGSARLLGKNIVVPEGQMMGVMGIFSSEHRRTDTALCLTDVELGVINKNRILELFYQNADFGAFLIRMIAERAALDHDHNAVGARFAVPGFSRWLT